MTKYNESILIETCQFRKRVVNKFFFFLSSSSRVLNTEHLLTSSSKIFRAPQISSVKLFEREYQRSIVYKRKTRNMYVPHKQTKTTIIFALFSTIAVVVFISTWKTKLYFILSDHVKRSCLLSTHLRHMFFLIFFSLKTQTRENNSRLEYGKEILKGKTLRH